MLRVFGWPALLALFIGTAVSWWYLGFFYTALAWIGLKTAGVAAPFEFLYSIYTTRVGYYLGKHLLHKPMPLHSTPLVAGIGGPQGFTVISQGNLHCKARGTPVCTPTPVLAVPVLADN
eukprot:gene6622-6358_t